MINFFKSEAPKLNQYIMVVQRHILIKFIFEDKKMLITTYICLWFDLNGRKITIIKNCFGGQNVHGLEMHNI